MAKNTTTFEVQTLQDERWVFESRFDDEASARTHGVNLLAEGEHLAIRIAKDWARTDGKHIETEIHVEYAKKKENILVEKIDDAPICNELEDYYGFDARLTMSQLLRNYVAKIGATPTELLHSYSEFRRVAAYDNVLVSVVAKVAGVQAAKLEVDAMERRDALYDAIGQLATRARDAESDPDVPSLREMGFPEAFETVARLKPEAVGFYTNVMLCRELVQTRNLLAKLQLLLAWMPSHEQVPGEAVRIMDGLISDLVSSPLVFNELIGEQRNLAHALCALVDLASGCFQPTGRIGTELSTQLNGITVAGVLPDTRKTLLFNVARILRGTTALDRLRPEGEPEAYEQVFRRLLTNDGVIGGGPMAEALVRRFLRFVEIGGAAGMRQAIAGAIEVAPDGRAKLRFLISLFQSPLAKDHGEDILARLDTISSSAALIDPRLPLKANLEQMTAMHDFVRKSPLPDTNRDIIANRIDDLLVGYISGSKIVERLDKPDDLLRHRAIRLLQLCAPGVLRSPTALNVVRSRVVEHLRQANFDDKYVEDLTNTGQRERALRDLKGMLERAGLR